MALFYYTNIVCWAAATMPLRDIPEAVQPVSHSDANGQPRAKDTFSLEKVILFEQRHGGGCSLPSLLTSAILTPMQSIAALLPYINIVISVLLIAAILLQQGDPDLGGAFGGGESAGASYHTRRGFEKTLFNATIVLAVLFAVVSFLNLVL